MKDFNNNGVHVQQVGRGMRMAKMEREELGKITIEHGRTEPCGKLLRHIAALEAVIANLLRDIEECPEQHSIEVLRAARA